jgi:thymidine kinase
MNYSHNSSPTFTIYTGPMFSGKTEKLLMMVERFKRQKKKVVLFKPKIDDRYEAGKVVTHSGWSSPAISIKNAADILEYLESEEMPPDVIAVDEAFMVRNVAEVLTWLFRNGITVLVSSIDLSASGKPFHEIEKMFPWATHVEKCAAVCTVCGRDAYYTHKKIVDDDDSDIVVGGDETYEPRCMFHSPTVMKEDL